MKVTVHNTTIDKSKIESAINILIDNGIDEDDAVTVLQALGYVLLDTELEPIL